MASTEPPFNDQELDWLLSRPMQVPQGWGPFICRCMTTMLMQRQEIRRLTVELEIEKEVTP